MLYRYLTKKNNQLTGNCYISSTVNYFNSHYINEDIMKYDDVNRQIGDLCSESFHVYNYNMYHLNHI